MFSQSIYFKERRQRRAAVGGCRACPLEATEGVYCARHAEINRRKSRDIAARRKEERALRDAGLVSSAVVAKALAVGARKVDDWATRGLIPSVPRGKQRRFRLEEVRAAVAAGVRDVHGNLCDPSKRKGRRAAEAGGDRRRCSTCRKLLTRDRFVTRRVRDKRNGSAYVTLTSDCLDCRRAAKLANEIQRRRAKKDTQIEPVSTLVVAERDGWRCAICRKRVTRKTWSLDHIVPLSQGGEHTYRNVTLAHRRCNSARGAGRLPVQMPLFAK